MDSVVKWMKVKSALRTARKAVLTEEGLNEDSLKELAEQATKDLYESGGDYETEDGIAYLVENQIFAHKNSMKMGIKREIKSRRKE
jgi:hypothetical protein